MMLINNVLFYTDCNPTCILNSQGPKNIHGLCWSSFYFTINTKITITNPQMQRYYIHAKICIPASVLTCFSTPEGPETRDCDKARGFRTCFTRYTGSTSFTRYTALWGYLHVKWEIENLSEITSTAPIFLQFNYFRQKYLEIASCAVSLLNNIWVRVEHSLMQKKDWR